MILRKLAIVALGAAALTSCKEGGDSMEGAALTTNWDSLSYSIGISVGNGLKGQQLSDVSPKVIAQGINDVLDSTALIDDDEANAIIGAFMDKKRNEKSAKATSVSEGFLEENAKNPDVVTTGSGLQYIVIQEGTGDKPSSTDKVKVHYHGTLVNGNVFDSSVDRGEPVEFPVNGVIPGWVEGLQLMSVDLNTSFSFLQS